MSKITYTTRYDGSGLAAPSVYDDMYTGFKEINGGLNADNLRSIDALIPFHQLQRHAVSDGGMVAATGNIDFFGGTSDLIQGWFDGVDGTNQLPETADDGRFLPIPGASVQFYVPFPAIVLLTWQVSWVNDATTDIASVLKLFVDGGGTNNTHARRVTQTVMSSWSGGSSTSIDPYLRDRYKSRYWCGHALVKVLNKGYHSASLRLCAHENIKQTRVRARSMKYIIFRRGDS